MADDPELEQLLAPEQSKLISLIASMNETSAQFEAAAVEFVAQWYFTQAKAEFEKEGHRSASLPPDKLVELKAEVASIQASAPDIVKGVFNGEAVWFHLSASFAMPGLFWGDPYPSIIEKHLRYALGRLATVLEKYGYLGQNKPLSRSKYLWREAGAGDDDRPYYPDAIDLTPSLSSMITRYSELFYKGLELGYKITTIRDNFAKTRAAQRWNEV